MKIQNVKGGYDFLPNEQKIRNYINDTLRGVFENYGYYPIETPILCYYDILADKYEETNDILKEIYKLYDQGQRKLGLRYDLTVPFAKFIALNQKNIKLPFKRYEINKVFRDGPVKVGRDREFTQCDVDVVGLPNQFIELELLSLYLKAFEKLGIDIIIKYNNRKLINGLIVEAGVDSDLVNSCINIVDKKEKISAEEFKNSFLNIGLNNKQTENLEKIFNYSLSDLNKLFENSNNNDIKDGLEEINNLENGLNKLGIQKDCVFCSALVRGQDYYTGNVFEVYAKNSELKCSIGGGGRYDKMITDFIDDGNVYPAVGISFGLSPIYEILKNKETLKCGALVDILIVPMGTETESIALANNLRAMDFKVDVDLSGRKLKKSLDYANKENIKYVIILGEDEVQKQKIRIKNMFEKTECELLMKDLKSIKDVIGIGC